MLAERRPPNVVFNEINPAKLGENYYLINWGWGTKVMIFFY